MPAPGAETPEGRPPADRTLFRPGQSSHPLDRSPAPPRERDVLDHLPTQPTTELGAINVLLAQQQPGDPYVYPKGSPEQVTTAYQEFWDAVEVVRALATRPETWEATFTVDWRGSSTRGIG